MLRIVAIVVLTALGSACSVPGLVYRNADWQLEYYAWKTVRTTSAQRHDWQPLLQTTLQHHREQELPLLITWLDLAGRVIRETGDTSGAECLVDAALLLYQRHAHLAVDLAAPLLAELDADQISHLARYTTQRHQDAVKRYLDADLQHRKLAREERFTERFERWTGKLNNSQRMLVRDALERIPDMSASWLAQRAEKTNTLVALLKAGTNTEELREYLEGWWVNQDGTSTETKRQWRIARDEFIRFMDELASKLTSRQRAMLEDRLGDLRAGLASFLPGGQPPADLHDVSACALTPA
jgi:hypothetical protein